jgi:D-aminopeptidase
VGGGTGMIAFDFKSGIGTASRRLPASHGGYTLGVLVQSNLGRMEDLRVDGAPVGEQLSPMFTHHTRRRTMYGSVIAVLATDAPMSSDQLVRLCRRAALGIGRVGSYAAHGSGEIVLAFSTANRIPRVASSLTYPIEMLAPTRIDAFFQAAIECTEEADPQRDVHGDDHGGHRRARHPGHPARRGGQRVQAGARLTSRAAARDSR